MIVLSGAMNTTKGHEKPSLRAILTDPNRITITITEAADVLGIARTTAFHAAATTGQIIAGVPVIRISTRSNRERRVVSTAHLRAALGIAEPS